jgi:hypothetical protein
LNGLDVNGKGKDKGFLDQCKVTGFVLSIDLFVTNHKLSIKGTYKDGTPCSSKHYDNYAPRKPDKGFQKKLGAGKVCVHFLALALSRTTVSFSFL